MKYAIPLLFSIGLLSSLHAESHTFYALSQYDSGIGQHHTLMHAHTTTDVGNTYGVTLHVTPFWSQLIAPTAIAKHLTHEQTGTIRVAGDRYLQSSQTVLPYHAIKHNAALDATEESATIKLTPALTNLGAMVGIFFDASDDAPGLSFSLMTPLYSSSLKLHESGATPTIEQFFAGTYEQTDPIQAPLSHGLWNNRRSFAYGPLLATISYNLIETEKSFVSMNGGLSLALRKAPEQTDLFSFHSQVYDHHKLHLGWDVGSTLYNTDTISLELALQLRYSYLFPGNEYRIVGIMDDDGSIPAYSFYLMGAEEGKAGVFPLTNVLHQMVRRSGLHQCEVALTTSFSLAELVADCGIGLFGRQEEQLNIVDWPGEMYAVAYPTYNTDAAFTNDATTGTAGGHAILLNKRFISDDMLLTSSAAAPARISTTFFASMGYNSEMCGFPIACGLGASYEHGLTIASAKLLTLWIKGVVSF